MIRILVPIAALVLAAVAFAQGPRFADAPRAGVAAREQSLQLHQGGQFGPSQLGASMRGALHGAIGLSEDELHARKEAGASIAMIAAEEGIGREALRAVFVRQRHDAIAALLDAGTITTAQAERMVERGSEVFDTVVDREGIAGGQHATGEPLMAQRTDAPRGPRSAGEDRQHRMEPMVRGPHGQRER